MRLPISDVYQLTSYLASFQRDIALERSKSLYLATPLWFNLPPRRRDSPGTISVKIFYRKVTYDKSTKWRRNIAENFNSLSRVNEHERDDIVVINTRQWHERYRRQTTYQFCPGYIISHFSPTRLRLKYY